MRFETPNHSRNAAHICTDSTLTDCWKFPEMLQNSYQTQAHSLDVILEISRKPPPSFLLIPEHTTRAIRDSCTACDPFGPLLTSLTSHLFCDFYTHVTPMALLLSACLHGYATTHSPKTDEYNMNICVLGYLCLPAF